MDIFWIFWIISVIITTWIAVVFDIIDKLKELAISGDAQAKVEVEKFEE